METLRAVALYGLALADHPFHPSLQRSHPVIWAMWCSLHTTYVQDVIAEWLLELRSGRMFWLPDRLVAAVREIGLQLLVVDRAEESLLHRALGFL